MKPGHASAHMAAPQRASQPDRAVDHDCCDCHPCRVPLCRCGTNIWRAVGAHRHGQELVTAMLELEQHATAAMTFAREPGGNIAAGNWPRPVPPAASPRHVITAAACPQAGLGCLRGSPCNAARAGPSLRRAHPAQYGPSG
ncbi:hypothetical protein ACTMU2_39550 [Cupriavidus basilensis]